MALASSLRSGSSANSSRIGHDRLHFLLQAGLVPTAEDELGDEIGRPPGGFTQRDAETNKIFSVHDQFLPALCCRPRLQAISSASRWRLLLLSRQEGRPVPSAPSMQLTP